MSSRFKQEIHYRCPTFPKFGLGENQRKKASGPPTVGRNLVENETEEALALTVSLQKTKEPVYRSPGL